jgi:alanyl-tRNA synthetase
LTPAGGRAIPSSVVRLPDPGEAKRVVQSSSDIRSSYLKFFEERGHAVRPGAPLAPDDPTLLFSVAGMVQFKPFYASDPATLEFTRATTVQKCLRANDLESVGRTLRHHTFFEMLGNFSFGDYFKAEAIEWAWEYTRSFLDLDPKRLWVSIYLDDDEADALWKKISGLPAERIVRLGKEDNFWGPAGNTGACGPSSELYYDTGPANGCGRPECAVGCSCDRYIEFWNLVFPQFDMQEDGTLAPLAHVGIDTGMGLERTTYLVQGVRDNFHTDLFRPIIETLQNLTHVDYERDDATRLAMNAVADHVRALLFTIAENIYPSNEGRGYVLRRILRRASGKLRGLGVVEPFLYRLVEPVVEVMGGAYPEIVPAAARVASLIEAEEQRFVATLETGMSRFEDALRRAQKNNAVLSGRDVFTLYDTYGFPAELTAEMAGDRGVTVDLDGFAAAMQEQRDRARASASFAQTPRDGDLPEVTFADAGETTFTGYDGLLAEGVVQKLRWRRGEAHDTDRRAGAALAGEVFDIVLDKTPFYATSGGQVADEGVLSNDDLIWRVVDVRKEARSILHQAVLLQHPSGIDSWQELVEWMQRNGAPRLVCTVQEETRHDTMRNHTATHLLHATLKHVLGEHVQQAGSLVAPDRLRFDFNHFQAVTADQLRSIEAEINDIVLRNIPVQTRIQPYEEAIAAGAIAMFGEKYDDVVRVVSVGNVSTELCGGTHVSRTGDIGPFVIVSEGSVASGVRRVEALTGRGALRWLFGLRQRQQQTAQALGLGSGQDPSHKIGELQEEVRSLRRQRDEALAQLAGGLSEDLLGGAVEVDGSRVVAARVEVQSVDALRELADAVRRDLHSGVAVLSTEVGGKIVFLAMVTDDLVKRGVKAGDLVKQVAQITGGGGGGKPHMAQAGGKDKTKWQEALAQVVPLVRSML